MTQNVKQTGSKIARLSAARLAAVQAVYQMKANDQTAGEIISEFKSHRLGKSLDGEQLIQPDGILFTSIIEGVSTREDDLSTLIEASMQTQEEGKSSNSAASVEPLLWSIMMCGAFELLAHHDIDVPIIISDYLEVTHAFYEGGEAKLVNAVLDRIAGNVRD